MAVILDVLAVGAHIAMVGGCLVAAWRQAVPAGSTMCTIILLHRVCAELPLVIAANRDEMYARRSSAPVRLALPGRPAIACGVDEERGGTWMGGNEAGLFVGVTNQRSFDPPDETRRSRGEVVMDVLRRESVAEVRSVLEALDPRAYNGFNLVYGDGQRLECAYARPSEPKVTFESVSGGVHVLPNDVLDAPSFPKVARVRSLLGDASALSWPALQSRLQALLADHEIPAPEAIDQSRSSRFHPEVLRALQALCIHLPFYGTRSATIAAVEPGRIAHYAYAAGAPCSAPFEDHTHLLSAFRATLGTSRPGTPAS